MLESAEPAAEVSASLMGVELVLPILIFGLRWQLVDDRG